MFISQLAGYVTGALAAREREVKGQMMTKGLIILSLMNLLLCEVCLGYATFTAVIEIYGYTVSWAAAVTCGMFLFQSAVFVLWAICRQKKHSASAPITKEYEAIKKVITAFLEGIRGK